MDPVVVMVSCHQYRDAWSPFVQLFRKYWPKCPYRCFMITDRLPDQPIGVEPFEAFAHNSSSWSRRLISFLEEVKPEFILLLHEDYFFSQPVKSGKILEAEQILSHFQNAGCVRLYPCPGADQECGLGDYGLVSRGQPYRISCQAALWRTSYLLKILTKISMSPDFELVGTPLSNSLPEDVYSIMREAKEWPLEYYCTAIVQGQWQRGALELCKRNGVEVATNLRPINEEAK